MKVGDIVCQSSVTHKGPTVTVTYSLEKGYVGNFLFLGSCKKDDAPKYDVEAVLRRLGYVAAGEWDESAYERAAKAIHAHIYAHLKELNDEHAETSGIMGGRTPWDDLPEEQKAGVLGIAKAALAVI